MLHIILPNHILTKDLFCSRTQNVIVFHIFSQWSDTYIDDSETLISIQFTGLVYVMKIQKLSRITSFVF